MLCFVWLQGAIQHRRVKMLCSTFVDRARLLGQHRQVRRFISFFAISTVLVVYVNF